MIEWLKGRYQKLKQVKLYPVAIVLLSLLLLSICANHEIVYESQKDIPYKLLYAVMHEVGIALFILGSITILLELSDFREYFFSRLSDILIKDEYISILDQVKIRDLENRIQKVLYFKNQPNDKNSFFYKVQNDVRPLLDGCYYEDYEIRVDCRIENNNLIKKTITKKFEIVNPNKDKIYEPVPLDTLMQVIEGIDDEKLCTAQLLSVKTFSTNREGARKEQNEIYQNIKLKYTKHDEEDISKYNIRFQAKHEIEIEDKCIVELTYTTITPLSDPHFLHRVGKPCKRYRCVYYFKDNNYYLAGYGFGFMDRNNKVFKNTFSSGMELMFKDWILPGDGVIFTLLKN